MWAQALVLITVGAGGAALVVALIARLKKYVAARAPDSRPQP